MDAENKPIYVTQPSLPPLDEFIPYLEAIWATKRLTNNGPFHEEFENALCDYLGVQHLSLFTNGTIALVTALQALRVTGEVITTPYSFVATAHSLIWNGLSPVFVDIAPGTFNLSIEAIEAAITPKTSAIMAVHCYGHPCDIEGIKVLANRYNLRVIYDAAHAFGVRDALGASILQHGDLSVLSFHATKVFNTFEGGAIVCPNKTTKQYIDQLKNFGFIDETTVIATGINGKLNEVQAAFGLLNLKHLDKNLSARACIDQAYRQGLSGLRGIHCPALPEGRHNYAYFPILVGPGYPLSRNALFQLLANQDIHCRRYFYPLISDFPMYRYLLSARADNLPVAKQLAEQVICLPIYPGLATTDVQRVINAITCASHKH